MADTIKVAPTKGGEISQECAEFALQYLWEHANSQFGRAIAAFWKKPIANGDEEDPD